MGGRYVFVPPAISPIASEASASLHGTDLGLTARSSPHLQVCKPLAKFIAASAKKIAARLHQLWSSRSHFLSAMGVGHARFIKEVHRGADTAMRFRTADVFDKQSANRDWEIILRDVSGLLTPILARLSLDEGHNFTLILETTETAGSLFIRRWVGEPTRHCTNWTPNCGG